VAVDFDALVLKPCIATFGEPITYTPAGGSPIAISGVFDPAYTHVTLNDSGIPFTSILPVLGIRMLVLPQAPEQDDLVTARGLNYIVRDALPDGRGHYKLLLNLLTGN
jgi:hypothetical protein